MVAGQLGYPHARSGPIRWSAVDKMTKKFSNHQVAMGNTDCDQKFNQRTSFEKFAQWIFNNQSNKFKNFAIRSGIEIIEDILIFVSFDGPDVWANRQILKLHKDGSLIFWLPKICHSGQID
jgi:4-alpha-glucanotransferase